jgi:hypothetical protein
VDDLWETFLAVALPLGEVREQRSRYADKPAVYLGAREIAHCEAPGHIDLRITRKAWVAMRDEWSNDHNVLVRPGRRDWIELRPSTVADVVKLTPLIAAAVAANR